MKYNEIKVIHIQIEEPYMESGGYQESLLAKYHRRICKDTCLIVSNFDMNRLGEKTFREPSCYRDKNGIQIVRLFCFDENGKRRSCYRSLYQAIEAFAPDLIMVHGMLLFDTWAAVKYKKKENAQCVIVQDSHSTPDKFYPNGFTLWNRFTLFVTRIYNRRFAKHCKYQYGINYGTIEIITKYLGADDRKTRLLPLGYDDDLIDSAHRKQVSEDIRKKYQLSETDFVIVHGGKLDEGKKTDRLLKCLDMLPRNTVMLIFGGFCDAAYEAKCREFAACANGRIRFLGPLDQKQIYDLYLSSDLAVFPGAPSVLRQQAVAAGLPIIIAVEDGDRRINIVRDGNGFILSDGWSTDELVADIKEIQSHYNEYEKASELLLATEYQQYAYSAQAKILLDDCLPIG